MQKLNDYLALIDSYIGGAYWFVFLLLGIGVFFTLYLGFPQVTFFKHAWRIVAGKFDKDTDEGDTTHFQALATALSGTVGTGNIAGVAFAIHLGGPAALFWMLVTAFLGMTTKFVEVTLSHKYREKTDDGTMAGGPMYYLKNAKFTIAGKPINLKWMAGLFAAATVISSFGTGNLPQINSIASAVYSTTDIPQWITGAVLAVILGVVIVGGISRIAKVTEKLVPGMAIIYFIGVLAVIIYNIDNVIPSIVSIFADVFTGSAATGGFLGAGFAYAFNRGVNRGLFSNEAGQGSAPIAHASAKAHEPVSEGMVAILEPFIDTIIICSLTGLALLSSGVWNQKHENTFQFSEVQVLNDAYSEQFDEHTELLYNHLNGSANDQLPLFNGTIEIKDGIWDYDHTVIHSRSIAEDIKVLSVDELGATKPFNGMLEVVNGAFVNYDDYYIQGKSLIHSAPLTSIAFTRSYFGDAGQYIITIGLLLFAFSTAISWSYYGDRAMTFLFGTKSVIYYRILYVLGFFLASFTDTQIIWTFSGIAIALMTIPNLIGLFWLRKEMKQTVKDYWLDFDTNFPDERKKK